MDSNRAKRRKLDHQVSQATALNGGAGSALDAAATGGTSRPSTFVLQAQELLDEVCIDYDKAFTGADDLLRSIKSTVEAIDPKGPTPIHQAASVLEKKHHVLVPFPDPKPSKDSPYKVSFAKPTKVNVVGSYVARTIVKSQTCRSIDMVVEMPGDIFQDKDYLDLRYFYKRAYYLAVLAASISNKFASSLDIAYDYQHGNRLLPVIVLTANAAQHSDALVGKPKKTTQEYQIRVITCAPEGLFPKHKLLPATCCIRSASHNDTYRQTPTPFYNSTLKAETCYFSYLKVISQAKNASLAFGDACMLGRVWLQQRGFGGSVSRGGFGHFEWSLLTALLLRGGGRKGAPALSPSLSSTQIFKALIQYLATIDLNKKPFVLGLSKEGLSAAKELGPVMFDSERQLNVAYKMSSWSASMLQHHAKWTHASLADQEVDQFNPTFIMKADLPQQCFDLLVQVDRTCGASDADRHDYRGDSWAWGDRIARILKMALDDRAELVHVQAVSDAQDGQWDLKSPPTSDSSTVLVGIIFDATNMARQVDHGPTAEEKEAAKKFRQFWGEKAELRRFKDGSILESLIWTQSSPVGLCEEIARYILKLHLRLDDSSMQFYGKDFSAIIPVKPSDTSSFQGTRQAFGVFEQDLRDLSDLPLQIRQVKAAAPELRFASVRPPSAYGAKGAAQPMDTIIYFEASGKWPENLAAIQRTKIAFLLRIGDLLAAAKPHLANLVGLEESQTDIENLAYLDVTYEEGVTFRLRIHSDLEESLLERRVKDKSLDQQVRTQGAQLLTSFKRLYTHLPLHTQAISTFCSRFPALSPTIRLVKHWFDSHKLSCHFLEELIELMALRIFVEPYPWQAPSSAMTGLLRTLQYLARWDWRLEPLILDFSGELGSSERRTIETKFEAWRKIDPGMNHTTLVVATSNDTSGTAYTIHEGRPFPSKVVATRMTTLARSACKLVKDKGTGLEPKSLFQPSLKEYDVVIHLNSKVLKGISRGDDGGKQSHFKNLDGRTGKLPQPIVQQPARALLAKWEALFSGPLLLFHGAPDDAVIAGLWNPQVQSRTFRVNLPCSFQPVGLNKANSEVDGSDELVQVNREGIIAEVARIGGDCIDNIYVSQWS